MTELKKPYSTTTKPWGNILTEHYLGCPEEMEGGLNLEVIGQLIVSV